MNNRSADASIKGYNYQFLHTIKDILENESENTVITVEGIEDLDIEESNETKLIQYKYHEEKSYVNSRVAKPIALMFNHFLYPRVNNLFSYKLYIYLDAEDLPELSTELLLDILKLGTATNYIEDSWKGLVTNENIVDDFRKQFSWLLTQKYSDLETDIIQIFQNSLGITSEESKIIYLSNGIKIINDLAIQKEIEDRKIIKRDFINKLNLNKDILYTSFLLNTKGFVRLKNLIKSKKDRKNSSDYIVYINNIHRHNIYDFLIDLVKKFACEDAKINIRPISYIINCSNEEYKNFKKNLYEYIVSTSEILLINDGTEDYCFNSEIFNNKPLINKKKGGNKINKISFNFKMIHESSYIENKENIEFSNPNLFILDSDTSPFELTTKQFFLNGLTNEQILETIGD